METKPWRARSPPPPGEFIFPRIFHHLGAQNSIPPAKLPAINFGISEAKWKNAANGGQFSHQVRGITMPHLKFIEVNEKWKAVSKTAHPSP